MSILIQNGTLICPDGPVKADLRVEGDKIAQIGPALPVGDSQVIDAAGKLVFPGFIDTHTHFEMNKGTIRETADNWESYTEQASMAKIPVNFLFIHLHLLSTLLFFSHTFLLALYYH